VLNDDNAKHQTALKKSGKSQDRVLRGRWEAMSSEGRGEKSGTSTEEPPRGGITQCGYRDKENGLMELDSPKGGSMLSRFNLVFIVFFSLCVSGCATRLADFTIISTKNIDLARGADFQRAKSRIEGIDSASIIIIIPTGTPNVKEAIDKAIESVPGAVALLDGVITYKFWYIPYIFGNASYVVEGTPLIDPALVTARLESPYIVSRLDKRGNVLETKYVSKAEFQTIKRKIGI